MEASIPAPTVPDVKVPSLSAKTWIQVGIAIGATAVILYLYKQFLDRLAASLEEQAAQVREDRAAEEAKITAAPPARPRARRQAQPVMTMNGNGAHQTDEVEIVYQDPEPLEAAEADDQRTLEEVEPEPEPEAARSAERPVTEGHLEGPVG